MMRREGTKQHDELERPAVPLEVTPAVKKEMSGSELGLDKTVGRRAVVVLDSDSDSDSDRDYARDEELLASEKISSMTKDSDREKLTGKKRTADIFQEDSPVELEEAEEGQDAASKKLNGHEITVRCVPKTICEVVALLNGRQREKVKELGFGCLLDFKMNTLGPRHLTIWLMDHLDPDTMALDFGGNRKLYISEHTVWCVLGLQGGKLDQELSTDKHNCADIKNKGKHQHQHLKSPQIEEQQTVGIREDEDALIGDDEQETMACICSETGQGTTPLEASAEVHGEPMLPVVHEDHGIPEPVQGNHAVTGVSEDGGNAVLVHSNPGTAEAVQLASTFVNEQVKDFMEGTTDPEVLENRLSKLVNLLAQMRSLGASDARTSELQQQVKELTQRLCKTEEELKATREKLKGALAATQEAHSTLADTQEELEATRVTLQGAHAGMLEAQSAVAAINSLALRLSATMVRLGDTRFGASPTAASSLEEAVKLLEDRVSHIESVSRGHATSLARSSVAFVAAALLSRDREGFEILRDAVAADTRRFVRSQGPEFNSLVAQVVVDAMEQQQGNALQMQDGVRGTGNAGTSK